MTSRCTRIIRAATAAALLVVAPAAVRPVAAAPDDAKPGGKQYRNADMGVRLLAPQGWSMVADKTKAPSAWQRLVTFNDPSTDAQAVLSARPRTASALVDLLASVRKDWDESAGRLKVSSFRSIEPTPLRPVGSIVVDASFERKAKTARPKPGEVPAPPKPAVTYRVQAVYFLAPDYEYLLYAQGQETHWSRLRAPLTALRDSVTFEREEAPGPKGAGSYRDENHGFACRFPADYTVVIPQRSNHLVQFEGAGAGDPVLGVYAFRWDESIEKDADRLIAYYQDEMGGQASLKRIEAAGRDTILLTATASVGGRERTYLLAIFKRGGDCFRLRASMPRGSEAKGEAVFRRFLDGFEPGAAPK